MALGRQKEHWEMLFFFIVSFHAYAVRCSDQTPSTEFNKSSLLPPGAERRSGRSKLTRHLLKEYETYVRPVYEMSTVTDVKYGLALTQIIDMDERNQRITLNVWLRQKWNDEFLVWNKSDYEDVDTIQIPATSIWRPDIVLYNNVDEEFAHIKMDTLSIITSDGNVFWMAPAILKSSCKVEVLHFPFDRQNCSLKFGSWAYNGVELNLSSLNELTQADVSDYINNGEWDLVNAPIKRNERYYGCCVEAFPDLTFTIILQRRPLFYVFNLLLPNCLIACLTLMGFYLPPDSGEKVTMVITNLLALIVFHQLLSESLPPTSDRVPLVALYFTAMIVMVSLSCVMTIWVLNLHYHDGHTHRVPNWVRKVVFGVLARIMRIKRADSGSDMSVEAMNSLSRELNSAANNEGMFSNSHTETNSNRYCCLENGRLIFKSVSSFSKTEERERLLDKHSNPKMFVMSDKTERDIGEILRHVRHFSQRVLAKEKKNHNLKEWKEIAYIMDRMLLVIFFILFLMVTLTLILSAMRPV
ncbi:neuronal acetylcholine receptor subunit alpha-10-like [Saccoglossus kowalevskii]